MSRRGPAREYYEEDEFEVEQERDRYPRSRRREREFDEDVDYRRRRSMPPVEDLERMHIRDRPPRDIVRDSFDPLRDQVAMIRRRKEEQDEILPEPNPRSSRRRGNRPREVVEEEESEFINGERERRGSRRHRRPRELEEEDMAVRYRERASDGDLRPMEKVYEDEREEVWFRPSSRPRRRPSRREVEFKERIIGDRELDRTRVSRDHPGPSFEEELVMQWKDRPSPREMQEEEEIRLRETRHRRRPSQPEPRYVRETPLREPPGAWSGERDNEEEEIYIRERRRSRPRRREVENEEDILLRREKTGGGRGRDSTDSDEILIRKGKRRSPSRESSSSPEPSRAPVHEDVITHHRHIDHSKSGLVAVMYRVNRLLGFETTCPPRAPSPEITSASGSFDEIDFRHR